MNGEVNSQNVRESAPQGGRPDINYDINASRELCTVWVGLCGNGTLLGPFFFEGTVTAASYLRMLNEKTFPQLADAFDDQFVNGHFSLPWWAQDGAPPHRSHEGRNWLAEFCRHHVIALYHDVEWSSRSPDLTPCDSFVWGYLKSKIYITPSESIDDLRQNISVAIESVKQDEELIRRSVRDMVRRAHKCREVRTSY